MAPIREGGWYRITSHGWDLVHVQFDDVQVAPW